MAGGTWRTADYGAFGFRC